MFRARLFRFPSSRVSKFQSFQVSELQFFRVSEFPSFQVSKWVGGREEGRERGTIRGLGTEHVISRQMRGLEKTASDGANR